MYNYTDHLGNIRLSYSNTGLNNTIQIQDQNHYYPFGLKHKGYNTEQSLAYKYKYNGKEFQNELGLNFYDYGARNYDAALGRWMNMDPLAENSRRWTPYNYAYNNPVFFVDSDGMQAVPTDGCGRDLSRAGAAYDFYNYEDKEEDHIIIRGKNAETGEMQPAIIIETSLVSTMIDIEDLPVFPTHDPITNKDTTKPIEIKGVDEFVKSQIPSFGDPDAVSVTLGGGIVAGISGSIQVAAFISGVDAGGVFLYTPKNPSPSIGISVGGRCRDWRCICSSIDS